MEKDDTSMDSHSNNNELIIDISVTIVTQIYLYFHKIFTIQKQADKYKKCASCAFLKRL